MVLVEPLFAVELFAAVSVVEVVGTVSVAAVVALSVSSSSEILVVFLLGTVVDLYAAVAVVVLCSSEAKRRKFILY